jgi:tetratricopeptide (TPR) repeat protein
LAFVELNRYEEALSAYDRALNLYDEDPAIYRSKAEVLRKLGRTAEAEIITQKASKMEDPWKSH